MAQAQQLKIEMSAQNRSCMVATVGSTPKSRPKAHEQQEQAKPTEANSSWSGPLTEWEGWKPRMVPEAEVEAAAREVEKLGTFHPIKDGAELTKNQLEKIRKKAISGPCRLA